MYLLAYRTKIFAEKKMMNRFNPNGQFKTNSIVIIVKCINFNTQKECEMKVREISLFTTLRFMIFYGKWNRFGISDVIQTSYIYYNGDDVLLHLISTLIHSYNKFFGIIPFHSYILLLFLLLLLLSLPWEKSFKWCQVFMNKSIEIRIIFGGGTFTSHSHTHTHTCIKIIT